MSERVDLREFLGGFVAEAEELLATAHALLREIDSAEAQGALRPRAVTDLYRALHTIKGLAGMVGVEPIVEIAHALETLLRAADRSGGRLRRRALEVSVRAVAAIGERVRAVAADRPAAAAPEELLTALAALDGADGAPAVPDVLAPGWDERLSGGERTVLWNALQAGPVWSLTFVPSEANAARGINIAAVRTRLGALGELIKVAPRTLTGERRGVGFDILIASTAAPAALAEAAAAPADEVIAIAPLPVEAPAPAPAPTPVEPGGAEPAAAPVGRAVVRVELGRLDELQEQLSGLIVSRYRLERELAALAEAGVDVRRLRELADLQARQLRELRRAILRVRMVRLSEVLEPLGLLVRSLARPGHKEVRFEVDARDAEVDKAVADRLLPALIHLVRNAVDHAIEAPLERVARGKERVGRIRVSCRELGGNQLELVVADDGRGLDRAALAARAGRTLATDDDVLEVITEPGFSTRDAATATSGRGLGMDIVKRVAVGELGGALALATRPGLGTEFTLRVPVTVAIIDVFSFACGRQAFVVPVAAVEEIVELPPSDRVRPPAPGAGAAAITLVERRGHALPVVSLAGLLAIDGGGDAPKALVIRQHGELLAFAVDRMIGRQEVVVRPIADPLGRGPGVAGATDLGDGQPTVVLDLFELGVRAGARTARAG